MNKWLKVGAGLLLLAWGPFLYAELSNEPAEKKQRALPSESAAADDTTLVEPIAEPEELPDPPAEPEAEKPAAEEPAAAAPTEPAQPAAAPAAPADPAHPAEAEEHAVGEEGEGEEEEPAPTPPTASGPAAALKQAYEQQTRDALWAADAEAKIAALFGNEEIPEELLGTASCRKAVCRVELNWTAALAGAYVTAYEHARSLLGGEIGVEPVGTPGEQGEQQVNLYLTRKGYTVADLTR